MYIADRTKEKETKRPLRQPDRLQQLKLCLHNHFSQLEVVLTWHYSGGDSVLNTAIIQYRGD